MTKVSKCVSVVLGAVTQGSRRGSPPLWVCALVHVHECVVCVCVCTYMHVLVCAHTFLGLWTCFSVGLWLTLISQVMGWGGCGGS